MTTSLTISEPVPPDPVAALNRALVPSLVTEELGEDLEGHYDEFIAFRVGDLRLACPFEAAGEIAKPSQLYPLPFSPDWLAGVTTRHGKVFPVADLTALLGLSTGQQERWLLVTSDVASPLGVLVDEMPDSIRFAQRERLQEIEGTFPKGLNRHLIAAYEEDTSVRIVVDLVSLLRELTI